MQSAPVAQSDATTQLDEASEPSALSGGYALVVGALGGAALWTLVSIVLTAWA